MRISILLLFFVVIFPSVMAQNDSTATKSGEIIDGEIVIEKEKTITLPKANKIFKKTELKSFNSDPLQLTFQTFQPTFDWPNYKSDVPFQSVDKQYPPANYQNYVRLGFGNYTSPLIEAGVFKQVGKMKLSTGLFHESFARGPVNDEFSGSANSSFTFSAKYQSKGFSITPYLEVRNQQYNFYGNTDRLNAGFSNESPNEASYSHLALGTVVKGSNKGLSYFFDAKATSSTQKLKGGELINKEPYVQALGGISVKIDTSFSAGFDLESYSSSYESGIRYDRSLFILSPWAKFQKNDLIIKGGFRVASSESANNKISGFYPFANAELKFSPDWSAYAYTDGGIKWNSLNELITQNQFMDDSLILINTETSFKIGGGIKGALLDNLNILADVSYASMANLPFYVPSTQDSSRFIFAYDTENTEVISLKIGAEYSPSSTSNYRANLEINGYTLETIDKPWHLPTVQFSLNTTHNINQKVIFSTNIISLLGIEAPSSAAFNREKLPTIIDLNMGVKYLITNRSSVFIDTNNLLNNKYERYIGYPVRGITFKIGGKYRF